MKNFATVSSSYLKPIFGPTVLALFLTIWLMCSTKRRKLRKPWTQLGKTCPLQLSTISSSTKFVFRRKPTSKYTLASTEIYFQFIRMCSGMPSWAWHRQGRTLAIAKRSLLLQTDKSMWWTFRVASSSNPSSRRKTKSSSLKGTSRLQSKREAKMRLRLLKRSLEVKPPKRKQRMKKNQKSW